MCRRGRSAPALQPPTFTEGSQAALSCEDDDVCMQESRLRFMNMVPDSGSSGNTEKAEECPACSVSVLRRYMEAVRTLLQPFEVCQGKNSISGPELEVTEDGLVTYEWKSVVERDRSFQTSKSPVRGFTED
eukprot:symbB.v1.2.016450.t1/scaffold1248.1/size129000/14